MKITETKINKISKTKSLARDNLWYGLIAILSLVVLIFFPMIGSGLPLRLNLPTSFIGWIIYIFSKIAVAVINMCIFHAFMEQGKLNVSTFWKKILADEILHRVRLKGPTVPLSPEQWMRKEYKSKGVSIAVTSVLSSFVLSQVILTFDIIIFISFLLTLLIGLSFGVMQLYKSEQYWGADYYEYALYVLEEYNRNVPPEMQLSVRNKNIYEGENIIYEYSGIQELSRAGVEE